MTSWRTAVLALIASSFLLYSASAQNQNEIDSVALTSVFGTPEEWEAKFNKSNKSKEDCVCVLRTRCPSGNNETLITSQEILIDIRFNVKNNCSSYMEVCCKKEDIVDFSEIKTAKVNTGCGMRNTNGVGFRIQGNTENESEFGEFPWMVAVMTVKTIEETKKEYQVYACGGALIHPQVVLTAAHCVNSDEEFIIRAGEWDTQMNKEVLPHQDRNVALVKIHENFRYNTLYNDVALLFLENPVEIAENVNVVCLPAQNANFDHSKCVATGWGKDTFGKEGRYQVILKKIDLPMVPKDKCLSSLRSTRLGQYFTLDKSFVCAGGEIGKDTCKGDGGSPLVCPIRGTERQYQQAGIVAWGIGCATSTPGVYVNVALFRNWIDREMKANNFDFKSYQY